MWPNHGCEMADHPHDYSAEVVVCSVCHRTEADITRSCHHCSDGVGRCWWCLRDAARAKDAEEISRLAQEVTTMLAREAKIREALRETPCHLDCADFPREKWCLRCAALEGEDTPHV